MVGTQLPPGCLLYIVCCIISLTTHHKAIPSEEELSIMIINIQVTGSKCHFNREATKVCHAHSSLYAYDQNMSLNIAKLDCLGTSSELALLKYCNYATLTLRRISGLSNRFRLLAKCHLSTTNRCFILSFFWWPLSTKMVMETCRPVQITIRSKRQVNPIFPVCVIALHNEGADMKAAFCKIPHPCSSFASINHFRHVV